MPGGAIEQARVTDQVRATESCLFCGRRYAGKAVRPRWAFDHHGQLLGSVHTSHEQLEGKRYPYWTAPGELTPEQARLYIWRHNIGLPTTRAHDSDAYLGWALAEFAEAPFEGVLGQAQAEQLRWWLDPASGLGIAPHRQAGILSAYERLVAQYLAWDAKN